MSITIPVRPGAARSPARFTAEVRLALYAAGIILGAGVFALPFQVPSVGLVPLIATLAGMAWLARRLYPRLIEPAESGTRAGAATLASAITRHHAGTPGVALGLLAATFYVIPAVMGYALMGMAALSAVSSTATGSSHPEAVLMGGAVAAWLAARWHRTPAVLVPVATLIVPWTLAVLVDQALGTTGNAEVFVLTAGFLAGVAVQSRHTTPTVGGTRRPGGLKGPHARNVATLTVQLATMAALAVVVIAVAAVRGTLVIPPLARVPSLAEAVTVVGVLLFALTGTGFGNVAGYPAMRTRRGVGRVIRTALVIVVVVQGGWIVATSLVVNPAGLAALNAAGDSSTVGMAAAVGTAGSGLASGVIVVGAVLLLFGVTGATNGFSETLATEVAPVANRALPRSGRAGRPLTVARIQRAVVVAGVVAAGGATVGSVPVSDLLAAGGLAGGTAIMFSIPALAEPNPARRRKAAVVAVALTLIPAGLVFAEAALGGLTPASLAFRLVPLVAVLAVTVAAGVRMNRQRPVPTLTAPALRHAA